MKRLWVMALFTGMIFFAGLTASAHDRGRPDGDGGQYSGKSSISAQDMSAAGLLAASILGAGIYMVRRRSKRRT